MPASLLGALLATIVVETIIASAILRRFVWLESVAIQLATWPVAQWLMGRTGAFWTIELGVVIVEIALWRVVFPMTWKRAAVVALAANATTAAIGWVIASS